ncbi:MAG: 4-alpha-glucanotransferase [Burkholderiales bacterium]|nr:4-alpha-glucanotransferase [Burkholderiales bacterium]
MSYRDIWGNEHRAPDAALRALLAAIGGEDAGAAAGPARCAMLEEGLRVFGPAVQLYALRSHRNWGMGDFTDLASLARTAAAEGASFVGVNPLHELFLDRPAQPSPYSPSSRLALNPWYLDVEAIPDYAECTRARARVASQPFQRRLAELRAVELVDYAGVAAQKRPVLGLLFDSFRRRHLARGSARAQAFRAFVTPHIHDAALFDALQAHFAAQDPLAWGWPAWPAAYHDRESPDVRAFAAAHVDDIDFYLYLQWQADEQLAHAARAARDAGMRIGVYRDIAVGANPGGAEVWRDRALFARNVHVGAPPDEFNQKGQDWGLPPWIPQRLAAASFDAWVALLHANMRHAGALRIDHVMGLSRLFWIPQGMAPADGAYVRYPLPQMLALLARESARRGCLVVGEDLGTVAGDLRQKLADAGVYSYRVLYFERDAQGAFLPPQAYPAQALVSISTHDLPTLAGFWQGADLAARDALDLFPTPAMRERMYADRNADRPRLRDALAGAGLDPPPLAGPLDAGHTAAIHDYVARVPCALMTVQLEDVFGQAEQVNLPATLDHQYPNWRRKVGIPLEGWAADGRFAQVCAAIRGQRG